MYGYQCKIKDLEEYRKTTVDDWKSLKELKDIVKQLGNDNDRLKQDIDTALLRCSAAQNEVSQLKLDSKTKCEENQRLQKQITQYEEHTEELQESLSNIRKEKQQLLESNKQLEKMLSHQNEQIQLATDKSTCLQERIKELHNENSNKGLNIADLSKQKEDAIKRIRDLENQISIYKDQIISATDDSKRFQERITELHGENSRLQHDIDDLSKQKEDALTRLNEILLINKNTIFLRNGVGHLRIF